MSAYDNDPRVYRIPDGEWRVTTGEARTVAVAPMHIHGQPTSLHAVFDLDGTFLGNTGRLDEVLHSLIGDPQ